MDPEKTYRRKNTKTAETERKRERTMLFKNKCRKRAEARGEKREESRRYRKKKREQIFEEIRKLKKEER